MTLSIIIPWRTDHGPRQRAFDWIRERYKMLMPAVQIIESDSDPCEPFNRGAARNNGVSASSGGILCLADADSIPIPAFIVAAANKALEHPWVIAYGPMRFFGLNEAKTEYYLNRSPAADVVIPSRDDVELNRTSYGGMLVMEREAFIPYDERFTGWGHEDVAFCKTMDKHRGVHVRVEEGYLCHMYHPRGDADFGSPGEEHNRRIFEREYSWPWVES